MKLINQQLSIPAKKREAFEGQVDEVGVIQHGQNSHMDSLTFALEAFLDPIVDSGVIIGETADSLEVASPDPYAITVAKGYGLTKDIQPIIVPNVPQSWQGHRAVYSGVNKWSLHPSTGDIQLTAGDYWLSLGYKEYSTYPGAAIANYSPEDVKYYHNYFLRAGTNAPAAAGGTGADSSAKGSDGSTGTNENDVFIAKININGAGTVTFLSFIRIPITSVVTSGTGSVWVGHKKQSHETGILAPFADRIDEDWGHNTVNDTLKPTVNVTDAYKIDFAPYKAGTIVLIDGDEIPEPASLTFDVSTILGSGDDNTTWWAHIDSNGDFGLRQELTGQGLYNYPADKLPLAKFVWKWNAGSPELEFPYSDPGFGTPGLWDERQFGSNSLKRWAWHSRTGSLIMDIGKYGIDHEVKMWYRIDAATTKSIRWFAGKDYPDKEIMYYDYNGHDMYYTADLFSDRLSVTDLLVTNGWATISGGTAKLQILSGAELYVDDGCNLNVKGVLSSYLDSGSIEGIWDAVNCQLNNPYLAGAYIVNSLVLNSGAKILMGNSTEIEVQGSGKIYILGGTLQVHAGGSIRYDDITVTGKHAARVRKHIELLNNPWGIIFYQNPNSDTLNSVKKLAANGSTFASFLQPQTAVGYVAWCYQFLRGNYTQARITFFIKSSNGANDAKFSLRWGHFDLTATSGIGINIQDSFQDYSYSDSSDHFETKDIDISSLGVDDMVVLTMVFPHVSTTVESLQVWRVMVELS